MRVAFLTNIVSPYRKPVFDELAATPGWDFRIFVNAANEFDRQWKVDTSELDIVEPRTISIRRRVVSREPVPFEQVLTMHVPVGLWSALRRFRPDVVISHELGPRSMVAAAYCRLHCVPLVIWAYQSRISVTQGHPVRRLVRRQLLKSAYPVVGMGAQAREVLETLGVPADDVVDAPNAADMATLCRRRDDPQAPRRVESIRKRIGAGRKLAVVVGRLVPLKGTDSILEAWRQLEPRVRDGWRLVFVGDGPLRELVQQAEDRGVVLAGHVPTDEMADWYQAADLHVFPSLGDVWGLVVNEAMACGTPTLCSIHAGCSDDLIEHGRDGLVFDPTAPDAAAALGDALQRRDLTELAAGARETVARFTIKGLADGFRRAVEQAAAAKAPAAPLGSAV
jgi:glycosyltransferase involved in cell wall biosynthesis